MDREISLPEVAAAHADALEVQIRTLRLRRAVLTAVARRGSTPEEMDLMHKLAKLSEDERRRLIGDFLDAAFGGLDANPEFVGIMRSMTPELPDNPEAEQVEAWVELAELSQDPDFRAAVRRMAEHQAAERARGDTTGLHRDAAATVRDQVGPALAAGIDPASPEADPVVAAVTARYAQVFGRPDDADLRHWLLTRLEIANDPRAGTLLAAARSDQRLAGPGEPGAGVRLVHPGPARPDAGSAPGFHPAWRPDAGPHPGSGEIELDHPGRRARRIPRGSRPSARSRIAHSGRGLFRYEGEPFLISGVASSMGRPKVTASRTASGAVERRAASGRAPSASLTVENARRSATNTVIAKIWASVNPASRNS